MKHQAKLAGQARHALTAVGGFLVASGYVDESTMQEIIGGVMALTGVIWSWVSPAKNIGSGDI